MSVRFFHLCLGPRNFSFIQIFWLNILAFLNSYSCYWISTNIIESSGHWTPTWAMLCLIKLRFSDPKPLHTALFSACSYIREVCSLFSWKLNLYFQFNENCRLKCEVLGKHNIKLPHCRTLFVSYFAYMILWQHIADYQPLRGYGHFNSRAWL